MIITSVKLYKKYKKHKREQEANSQDEEFEPNSLHDIQVPDESHGPFASPSPLSPTAAAKYVYELPTSTSQCLTPRPRSAIGIRATPTPEGRHRPSPRESSPQSGTQLPRARPTSWGAEPIHRTRPQQQPCAPTEIAVRGKWVWVPDAESPAPNMRPVSPPKMPVPGYSHSRGTSMSTAQVALGEPHRHGELHTASTQALEKGRAEHMARVELPASMPASPQHAEVLLGAPVFGYDINVQDVDAVRQRYETWGGRTARAQSAADQRGYGKWTVDVGSEDRVAGPVELAGEEVGVEVNDSAASKE